MCHYKEVKLMLFLGVFLDDDMVYIEKHGSNNWIAFKFNLMGEDYFLKENKHFLEVNRISNRTMHFLSLCLPVDHLI